MEEKAYLYASTEGLKGEQASLGRQPAPRAGARAYSTGGRRAKAEFPAMSRFSAS
jgi:hypothetical protein